MAFSQQQQQGYQLRFVQQPGSPPSLYAGLAGIADRLPLPLPPPPPAAVVSATSPPSPVRPSSQPQNPAQPSHHHHHHHHQHQHHPIPPASAPAPPPPPTSLLSLYAAGSYGAHGYYMSYPAAGPIGGADLGLFPHLGSPYELKEPHGAMLACVPPGVSLYGGYAAASPYAPYGIGDPSRPKSATRESTSTLKAWLNEHRKNPYPSKGEKIMLAIITRMTLTQVSTWFANARRRLKKESRGPESGDQEDGEPWGRDDDGGAPPAPGDADRDGRPESRGRGDDEDDDEDDDDDDEVDFELDASEAEDAGCDGGDRARSSGERHPGGPEDTAVAATAAGSPQPPRRRGPPGEAERGAPSASPPAPPSPVTREGGRAEGAAVAAAEVEAEAEDERRRRQRTPHPPCKAKIWSLAETATAPDSPRPLRCGGGGGSGAAAAAAAAAQLHHGSLHHHHHHHHHPAFLAARPLQLTCPVGPARLAPWGASIRIQQQQQQQQQQRAAFETCCLPADPLGRSLDLRCGRATERDGELEASNDSKPLHAIFRKFHPHLDVTTIENLCRRNDIVPM
ncbi:unnamed protein product [Lampetra fluviatilis]